MNREQYLLNKLAEEASEIAQIALKSAQFGLNEVYIDESNKKRCHNEINDLLGIIRILNVEFNFEYDPDIEQIEKKIEKVNRYYGYSKELGMVKDETI